MKVITMQKEKKPSKKEGGSTIMDVARLSGVSTGTVSRVINGYENVGVELRRKVLFTSRKLGFMPKIQYPCIGLITGKMSAVGPINSSAVMIMLLMQALASKGYVTELIDQKNLDRAVDMHVAGVIGIVFDEEIASLKEAPHLPIVTINQNLNAHGIHSVASDHFQEGVLATGHLLAKGHSRIAFLENRAAGWGSQERLRGYSHAIEQAGLSVETDLVRYAETEPLYLTLDRLLRRGATAFVNFSEDSLLETIHILTHILRKRIPEDVSVVSLENIPVYQYLSPPHTVIRQSSEEIAKSAAGLIVELCSSRGKKGSGVKVHDIKVPCSLVERDSVGECPTQDETGNA
ncbi:MAG: LacI family DNA-binding transcriptional regulator [Verrucomicrobia bacterium]|nr:LacI family DNA-binding transcriptional regulator [Verrucomicrobiota bacterium]